MKLSTRLVVLILGCLLPILVAQVYSQVNLMAERRDQVKAMLLRQVELANANMASIVDNVRQLAVVAGQFNEMQTQGGDCGERLSTLQRGLPRYRYLALYAAADGRLACASAGAPSEVLDGQLPGLAELLATRDVTVGPATSQDEAGRQSLPIGIQMAAAAANGQPRVLIAGLSSDWLSDQLTTAQDSRFAATSAANFYVSDRDGAVLGRISRNDPMLLPGWLRALIGRDAAGVETVADPDGHRFLVGFVPATIPPSGIAVLEVLPQTELTQAIDRATLEDLLVIGGAACIALLLAWAAGRRFVFQPTESLLQAARKWREGDLTARASVVDAGFEFSALALSFNAMAAGLEARQIEQRLQSGFLESQVAERTRELSESNNRLQVEIAGREKTEAALHQAQKLQAVGQLAGGIAHDFNNMLATVLGNLELMERRVSQAVKGWTQADTERLLKLIERASGAVQRGGQLTSRLLAFSRRQRLAARPTDVNALLRELITLATSTLGRRVQVVPELSDDLWPALVDPSQVEAAILNLCLNARDAMPEGGVLTIATANVTAVTRAAATDLAPGEYVRICISDNGCGMTADVKARAFDPFFTTKGPGAGSGLGLSQVYGMARQSGGGVTIDSAPGEGTRITLALPRAVEATELEAAPAIPIASRPPGSSGELILIVDDDHAVRQVTVEMARDLGFEVAQAASGDQALALLGTTGTAFKFILLDYAMPGMNGLQLARALTNRGVTAPMALVTGYAELSQADITSGQLAGLLRKPFTIRELQALLTRLRAIAAGEVEHAELESGYSGD